MSQAGRGPRIRVMIADDHSVVRQGVKQILDDTTDLELVGSASTGEELLSRAGREEWDVVVLDLSLPGRGGLETLKELKARCPRLPVLILTMHAEDQFAVRALRAGAAGFLNKAGASDELVTALRKLYSGGRYLTAAVAEKLAEHLDAHGQQSPHESLSDRELQVLCLIAEGNTVKQIAEKLFLSANTVSTYRARILTKMALKTNAELTRYAIVNHLVGS